MRRILSTICGHMRTHALENYPYRKAHVVHHAGIVLLGQETSQRREGAASNQSEGKQRDKTLRLSKCQRTHRLAGSNLAALCSVSYHFISAGCFGWVAVSSTVYTAPPCPHGLSQQGLIEPQHTGAIRVPCCCSDNSPLTQQTAAPRRTHCGPKPPASCCSS
jgi:hypothetical protein